MKSSKLVARLVSVVLAVMMLFSLVTVGFTASAAEVETVQTGAATTADLKLYLTPNSNWNIDSARFAVYLFGNGEKWVSMTKVANETNLYEATVPAGYTGIIFCRMNPGNTTNDWSSKWNQTADLTWDGTKNHYTVKEGTWDSGGGTWSVYTPPVPAVAPATPAAATVTFNNTLGGTGTEADPYLVTPVEKTSMIVTGVLGDATGLAYNVNYTATKVDWAAGTTSVLYGDLSAPALDETLAVNVYLWAYNATATDKAYSAEYATTTVYIKGAEASTDDPVVDNTFTLPYQVVDGLYAYAGTEVAGVNAWQRWTNVNDVRNFYLPTSASDTEVIVLNTYSAAVMLNGVMINAGEYATVPYVDGTTYVCSGATTQSVKIQKTDAEGTIFVNEQEGTTYKNDAGTKGNLADLELGLYDFMTSGTKNQETGNVGAAVASAENGVQDDVVIKKLKGRGNSTWNLDKKPFNITYDSTIEIDGMAGKKWSLLANAQESSLLRNRLVYDLANEVGMVYACDSRFVDMFVDGQYKGSYQLTQKIEMGKNTVMPDLEEPEVEDVTEDDGTVTPYPTENFDFILELDTATNAASAGDMTFTTSRGQTMTHKTPDEPAAEQVAFMKAKYQAVEDALYGNDLATLATLVDINDFARAYLVNEVAKNLDSGVTSCYFVYDSAKDLFVMSPVWDYDNALGNSVSISDRHDANGITLDLTKPSGWYAKELMHYDTSFTGGKSVFAQACSMTTTTADGKTFMDIVKEVWNADFADTAAILAGDAEATGRLQSDYISYLTKSAAWNYNMWSFPTSTNNTWISNHSSLVMYTYDAEANTITSEQKTYEQDTFAGQANYATDWMISRINWLSAQFNEAETAVPDGYITVYFTNNWNFDTMNVYYWNSQLAATPAWPGEAMTFVEYNDNNEAIYSAVIPGDVEGMLFSGISDEDHTTLRQTADIKTGIVDGAGFYCVSETDGKIAVGTYTYGPSTPDVPATTTTVAGTPDVPATTTVASSSDEPTGTITVYFSNSWMWTDITLYYWLADGTDNTWPGTAMTFVEKNDYDQDIYKATIPANAAGMIFVGKDNGNDTQSPDITDIKDGYGYYMDWNETDGTHVGSYEYAPTVKPETTTTVAAATTTVAATTTAAASSDDEPAGTITVYFSNSWMWTDITLYYWLADGTDNTWPGTAMTFVEKNDYDQDIYKATIPADAAGMIFVGKDNGSDTQSPDITDIKDGYGYYMDWNETDGTHVGSYEYAPTVKPETTTTVAGATTTTAGTVVTPTTSTSAGDTPDMPTVVAVYAINSAKWEKVNAYVWDAAGTPAVAWPGTAMEKTADTVNGFDIYALSFDSTYTNIIFNDGTNQTDDLTVMDGQYYDIAAKKWYASLAEVPGPDTTVKVAGSFTEWADAAIELTADETGKIYTATDIRLDMGTYEFKIVEFGTWMGNAGTIENVAEGWTFRAKDADGNDVGNCTLKTKGGVYTFTFDTETDKLTVTAVLDTLVYDVTWNEGNFTVNAPASVDEATDLTFTVEAAEGYTVAAVIADMKLIEAVDGVYTIANVQSDINLLVIVAEIATEPEVMTFTVTFVDKDGNTIATETVEYGQAATAPEAPEVDGYNFTGWDTKYDFVTMDLTVKATYKKISAPIVPATTGKLRIEIAGGNMFTIAVNGGNARPQGASYTATKMPIGAAVEVVAPAIDGATFIGWMNESGAIVSTTDTYAFTTSGNDYLKAVYQTVVEGVNAVTFKNAKAASGNGQILEMQYYAAGDEIVFPNEPSQAGYTFTGWSHTAEQIQTALAAGEDVTVVANWEIAKVYLDVTVNGGTITGGLQSNGQVLAFKKMTVTADAAPAGQKFAYWQAADGKIMSYTAVYESYPATNIELTAVFVAEGETIAKQPLVFLSADPTTAGEKIHYTMSWDIDASIGKVTAAGLMIIDAADYNEDTFYHGSGDSKMFDRTVGSAQVKQQNTGYGIGSSGRLYDHTYYACTFVIYTDAATGESVTIYSDMVETYKQAP